jgi:valyl-tRNA synthetase
MPHLTEELWAAFGFEGGSIQFQPLPQKLKLPVLSRKVTAIIYELVEAGRNLRAEARVASNQKATFALRSSDDEMQRERPVIAHLLNASELIVDPKYKAPIGAPVATTSGGDLFLVVEVDREAERERLDKEIAKVEGELRVVETKLKDKSFVERAPAAVVEEHRRRLKDFSAQLAKLKRAWEGLN